MTTHSENDADVAVPAYPFVSVVTHASGIHPSTSRLISLDAVTFNEAGDIGESTHFVINPGTDPGPMHMHGLTHEEVEGGQRFSKTLRQLDSLIDGRVLVVHGAPATWGFIVSEARRAMNAAARANRSRGRSRGKGRRRQRVGHVPRPEMVVDTLATARRQGVTLPDTRIADVAKQYGLTAPTAVASVERAGRDAAVVARELNEVVLQLHLAQRAKDPQNIAERNPKDLRADRFGLQRSHVRVDAMETPRPYENPGVYEPGKELARGMEVVVAPEITTDPNVIIEACLRHELAYSEKLTRQTSVVVCNQTTNLDGKAMHAARKGIPLLADTAFLAAVDRMSES